MTLWLRGAVLALPTASSGERRTHSSEWEELSYQWGALERRTHSSEWEGTQTPRRERHAHRWPSIVRGAMLARPARRATYHRALRSGELIPQNERELRRSEGSGLLTGDPLVRGAMLALPITSSGEQRTHSSEWEGTQTLRRERHAHRWPSSEGSNASSTYNELWRAENLFENALSGSPPSGLASYLSLTSTSLYPYPQAGEGHESRH